METLVHAGSFIIGAALVAWTLYSVIRTLVLPRGEQDVIAGAVFRSVWWLFSLRLRFTKNYAEQDRIMAFFSPFGMLSLLPTWYILIGVGYMCMYWGTGGLSWYEAMQLSGSSLITLGFSKGEGIGVNILIFSEATLGLILVALLIAYLPTIYAAFQRREALVTMLEVRAGQPPSAVEMLLRFNRIHGLDKLSDEWRAWEAWFADLEESHTSFAALVFLRSPHPEHSWLTAAGAVLDAASLTLSSVDIPADPNAMLCIRAGYLSLQRIAAFFNRAFPSDPHFPETSISLQRSEFDQAIERLRAGGVPLKADLDQAWQDFGGWRVNYDAALIGLARLVRAPRAPWSSDREPTD